MFCTLLSALCEASLVYILCSMGTLHVMHAPKLKTVAHRLVYWHYSRYCLQHTATFGLHHIEPIVLVIYL